MSTPQDLYALLGVPKNATAEQIRIGFKEQAMVNHPDRGGDQAVYSQIQVAYETLSDANKRAAYDSGKGITSGSSEKQFAQSFADGGSTAKPKMNISQQVSCQFDGSTQSEALDVTRLFCHSQVDDARRDGQIAQMGNQMSHTAGFDAWMRNQKGLGKHGFYTAEDLLRQKKGGIEATDATSISLPPLSTMSIGFDKHGPPEEVRSPFLRDCTQHDRNTCAKATPHPHG